MTESEYDSDQYLTPQESYEQNGWCFLILKSNYLNCTNTFPEINHLVSSILNKLKMSSNHIASINNLINNDQEDEDRKFLRAAAEAIVATSMNNEIDPTILELLRRIQYANAPNSTASPLATTTTSTSISSNPLEPRTTTTPNVNFLDTTSNLNPAKNSHHFPTFNLDYFENLANEQQQKRESTTNPTHLHSSLEPPLPPVSASSSSWSITNSQQQTPTPNSQDSTTPPSAKSINGHEPKPFICNDCSLSFRRSSDLRRHQRAHLPILPHICRMCGKGFARKDALKRHSDTLTCKRNREKLLSSGGDVESILAEAKKQGHDV